MKYDKKKIRSTFTVGKDKSVKVSVDTKIYVPAYFKDKGLYKSAPTGGVLAFGSYGIVQGNTYARGTGGCFTHLLPSKIESETIDDMDYIVLLFNKGDTVISTLTIVQDKMAVTELLVQYLLSSKIPWYLDYEDVIKPLLSSSSLGGIALEERPETLELLWSLAARSKDDNEVLLRHLQTTNPKRKKYTPVALSNVHFGTFTTLSKITGNFQSAGIASALISKTDKVSGTERILRA